MHDRITRSTFWACVDPEKTNEECWPWAGEIDHAGHARMELPDGSGTVSASEVAYEIIAGPLNPDFEIRHSCDDVSCVNPMHLIPISMSKKPQDALRLKNPNPMLLRPTCDNGHAMIADNIYTDPSRGYQSCRLCNNERGRRHRWMPPESEIEDGVIKSESKNRLMRRRR